MDYLRSEDIVENSMRIPVRTLLLVTPTNALPSDVRFKEAAQFSKIRLWPAMKQQ